MLFPAGSDLLLPLPRRRSVLSSLHEVLRFHFTAVSLSRGLQDQRLLFQLKKQEVVEVLRSGDTAEALGAPPSATQWHGCKVQCRSKAAA